MHPGVTDVLSLLALWAGVLIHNSKRVSYGMRYHGDMSRNRETHLLEGKCSAGLRALS